MILSTSLSVGVCRAGGVSCMVSSENKCGIALRTEPVQRVKRGCICDKLVPLPDSVSGRGLQQRARTRRTTARQNSR